MKQEAHVGGVWAAVIVAALATAATQLTTLRGLHGADALWVALFAVAWLLMSAAAVNFDMKRWLW